MKDLDIRIAVAKEMIASADHILIGAGAGLSTAAGLEYGGKRFLEHFSDFREKYGITDMYSASFYPFKTKEEHWAQWARHIQVNRFNMPPTELYKHLFDLVREKSYFVITTNVESQFVKSGFPEERVFEVQGNYAYLQCATACHDRLYYNEDLVSEMEKNSVDCRIPTQLIPKCPVCGGEMDVNLRHNQYFVQDERWYMAQERYETFLNDVRNKNLLLLEFGVGFNTPGIIRYPFEKLTFEQTNAQLIRFNRDYTEGVQENKEKTVSFDEDITYVIAELKKGGQRRYA